MAWNSHIWDTDIIFRGSPNSSDAISKGKRFAFHWTVNHIQPFHNSPPSFGSRYNIVGTSFEIYHIQACRLAPLTVSTLSPQTLRERLWGCQGKRRDLQSTEENRGYATDWKSLLSIKMKGQLECLPVPRLPEALVDSASIKVIIRTLQKGEIWFRALESNGKKNKGKVQGMHRWVGSVGAGS